MKIILRVVIFTISLFFTILYFIAPSLLSNKMGGGKIYFVIIAIVGICLGFVYGIGYKPNSFILRILTNPIVVLILIFVPIFVLKYKS